MNRYRILLFLLAVLVPTSLIATPINLSIGSGTVANGGTITIPIDISGVTDLFAFQFDLSFPALNLQALSVSEGPFLSSSGATFFIPGFIDNSAGSITFIANTLIGLSTGASGSGSLAFVDFQAIASGIALLDMSNVVLLDSNLADISSTQTSGTVQINNVPEPGTIWLLAMGLPAVLWFKRRRSRVSFTTDHDL